MSSGSLQLFIVLTPDESGSGSRRSKLTRTNRKKGNKISCFEVLDGLF